jgi:hypothetical protein
MPTRLPIRLSLLCAAPAAIAAWIQLWIFPRADADHWSANWTLLIFGTITVQTAATFGFAGRYLSSWRWRTPALVWLLFLTNFELWSIDMHGGSAGEGAMPVELLVHAFSAAEIAAFAIWVVLGDAPFGRQAALLSCLSVPLLMAIVSLHLPLTDPYRTIVWGGGVLFPGAVLVQTACVFALCGILHFLGFRISSSRDLDLPSPPVRQFSIRRLSMYVLVVAFYSLAIQGFLQALRVQVDWRYWLLLFTDGVLLATTSLAAAWAVLVNGKLARLASGFVALAALAAAVLAGIEMALCAYLEATLGFNGPWAFQWIWIGAWWAAWTLPGGLFLASLLLVLRTAGYRLARGA